MAYMAYMSQEKKKELIPGIKAVLKKYNVNGSIAVKDHASLVVTLTSGAVDFTPPYGYEQENRYHIHEHYSGTAALCIAELSDAMNVGNIDKSDSQDDFSRVGWYTTINIGRYDKHYRYTPTV